MWRGLGCLRLLRLFLARLWSLMARSGGVILPTGRFRGMEKAGSGYTTVFD
jgi:hypothetical protein